MICVPRKRRFKKKFRFVADEYWRTLLIKPKSFQTMPLDNALKFLLTGTSLTAGAALTALRAKLASTKKKNWLHWLFYILSSALIIACVVLIISSWAEVKSSWYAITVTIAGILAGLFLIMMTVSLRSGNRQYKPDELDPIVNSFSKDADKHNIKLLAGNMSFLGRTPNEIDRHPQFVFLREADFAEIQILCTQPTNGNDEMRYGKIISDLPKVQIRYYRPTSADLKVRGRIKTMNNVTRLLIYNKLHSGQYEALEHDTADRNGALYSNLWNLVWGMAEMPATVELEKWKMVYQQQKQYQ